MAIITYYSTDDDLLKIRPNILNLGVPTWEDLHVEAFDIINRTLISRWFKAIAIEHGVDWLSVEFNPDRVDVSQLVRLSCYKTLELAYMQLMKDTPESDGFERHRDYFEGRYTQELLELLGIGINYDWDEDDIIATDEKYETSVRRLRRA